MNTLIMPNGDILFVEKNYV